MRHHELESKQSSISGRVDIGRDFRQCLLSSIQHLSPIVHVAMALGDRQSNDGLDSRPVLGDPIKNYLLQHKGIQVYRTGSPQTWKVGLACEDQRRQSFQKSQLAVGIVVDRLPTPSFAVPLLILAILASLIWSHEVHETDHKFLKVGATSRFLLNLTCLNEVVVHAQDLQCLVDLEVSCSCTVGEIEVIRPVKS